VDTFIVTVEYRVKARDGQDAVWRASQYQTSMQYAEYVEEVDCSVQRFVPRTVESDLLEDR
jgi:hypothetical protein